MTDATSSEDHESADPVLDAEPAGAEPAGADSGPTETGPTETGPTETGPTETGPTETVPDVSSLEREGDVAADYLEGLLDIADLDGDIDLDVENNRAMVSIVGDDLDDLVGAERRTLDALQELTRLAVLRETGERSRLMLDVGGARARRRAELTTVAEEAVAQARADGAPVALSPMNPFERKVVHDAVAAAGLTSESDGVEPNRYVVVSPSA